MEIECYVCMTKTSDIKTLVCSHEMCTSCFKNWEEACSKDNKDVTCPCCRKIVKKIEKTNENTEIEYVIYMGDMEYDDREEEVYGLELVNGDGNVPTWRELLVAQQYEENREIIDENDELIAYNEVYDSDDDSSCIDYPDEDDEYQSEHEYEEIKNYTRSERNYRDMSVLSEFVY